MRRKRADAFSLVELLVVITIVTVIAGVVLSSFEPSMHDQLRSAAQVVAADLASAQSLAVTNNTSYKITFNRQGNLYFLEHSGSNSALDTLPAAAFGLASDPDTRRTTDLSRLPLGTATVRLYVVQEHQGESSVYPTEVTTLEFGPLGETSRSQGTRIWLAAGRDSTALYLPVSVDPITGIPTIGSYQSNAPFISEDASADESTPAGESSGEDDGYDYGYGTGDTGSDSGTTSSESGTGYTGDGSL